MMAVKRISPNYGRAIRARLKQNDDGFTLVELLVVIILLTIVMALLVGAIVTALQNSHRQVSATHSLNQAKNALERVTRELRGANPLLEASADSIEVQTLRVMNGAGEGEVYRFHLVPGANGLSDLALTYEDGTQVALVMGLRVNGDPVFTYYDEAGAILPLTGGSVDDVAAVRTVGITLRMAQPRTDYTIDLNDRVTLRNYSPEAQQP